MFRSRIRWSLNYLGPGAGAEIKFVGCCDEDNLIYTSISIVLLIQYMAGAGAENKKFRLRNTEKRTRLLRSKTMELVKVILK